MGAWIETRKIRKYNPRTKSHPSWVRGLKLSILLPLRLLVLSHPSWVRGLKQRYAIMSKELNLVAPLVGAWIETGFGFVPRFSGLSHPSWVRGLKLIWISVIIRLICRTPRGCVD